MKEDRKKSTELLKNRSIRIRQELNQGKVRQIVLVTSVACILLILFRFVSSFFPISRLWGFNHLSYFSLPFRMTITAMGILLCLPLISKLLFKTRGWFSFPRLQFSRNLLYLFISFFSFIFFGYFRTSTYLLGDGNLLVGTLSQGINPMLISKEHLTLLIHFYLYQFLNNFLGWDVRTTYALVSCLSGAVFVFLLLKFLDLLKLNSFTKGLYFLFFLSMGSSQLFFGYLEDYTLHYVSVFAYIVFGMRYLGGQGSLLILSLLCLLTIGFHNQGMVIIPSFIFIILYAFGKRKKNVLQFLKFRHVTGGIILSLLIMFVIYLIMGFYEKGTIFVPLFHSFGEADSYTLFSFTHLLDILNQQFLISSAGIILLLIVIIPSLRIIDWDSPSLSFLVLIGFYYLLFNFIINHDLGMARDWDLFAASGLGYSVLAVFLVKKMVDNREALEKLGIILAGTAVVSAIPWFWVNYDEGRSLNRFKNLLVVDRDRSAYGYEILSIYYREKGMIDGSIDALKNSIEVSPENHRYYYMLGNAYQEKGLFELAIAQYEEAIRIMPSYIASHMQLGDIFTSRGRYDRALMEYKIVIEISPGLPEAHHNIAVVYYRLGKYELALRHLRTAESLGIKVNPQFTEELNRVLKNTDRR
jgi:hypothetical protein